MSARPRDRWSRLPLCLALAVAILVLQRFTLADHQVLEPIATAGQRDEVVATDDFTIEVTDVQLADTATDTDRLEARTVEANGMWVLVWARVTATHEPILSTRAELRMADGTLYAPSPWFLGSLDGATAYSTAVPVHGAFVFEVPEDRVDAPELVLTATNGSRERLAAQASVDLGIDAADLDGERGDVEVSHPVAEMGDSADAPA